MNEPKFKVGDKVIIKKEHCFITELPDSQRFRIAKIEKEEEEIGIPLIYNIYFLETPLGVKFTANEYEIYKG